MSEILDSGNRAEFATGAVRDMQDDKGRCDLLPLEVVNELIPEDDLCILDVIEKYKSTKNVEFLYATVEIFSDKYFGGIVGAMLEVSIHFRDGAQKYGENNWQKGLPTWSYLSSAVRHYLKFMRGDQDERHDRAFLWNLLCLIWTLENKKDGDSYEENKE